MATFKIGLNFNKMSNIKRKIDGYLGGARVEALVIDDCKILIVHRVNHGQEYYVLPGGGWEENETEEEGVKREVFEETSLDVEVERPVFSLLVENDGQKLVYLCKYLGGEPKLGDFNEKKTMESDGEQFYEPMWLPIQNLSGKTLYTLEFRDWFLENFKKGNLPEKPFVMKITKDKFRE